MEQTAKVKMLSIGELLTQAKKAYQANWRQLLALAFLPYALTLATFLVATLPALGGALLGDSVIRDIYQVLTGLLVFATYLAMFVLSNLASIALMLMVKTDSGTLSLKESLSRAWSYFWPYIWVNILVTLLLLLWSLLLVIPAIIMAVYYGLALWVFLDGQHRGYGAIKESKALVRGYWWPVFGRFLVWVLISLAIWGAVAYVIFVVYGGQALLGNNNNGSVLYTALINIFSALFMPFYLHYSYRVYQNLVSIKDSIKNLAAQ